MICNLLAFYKNYFHTILVFSPTIDSDEKWDWVKAQKLVIENLPLKRWIRLMSERKKKDSIVQPAPLGHELEGLVNARDKFTGHIPEENFFNDYDDGTFMSIMEEQMAMIKMLKKHGETKFLANRILIIFDDLVGSSLFAGTRGSYFKGRGCIVFYLFHRHLYIRNRRLTLLGVNTRHRHYSSSFLMVSQGKFIQDYMYMNCNV